jgi:hypothetical protein
MRGYGRIKNIVRCPRAHRPRGVGGVDFALVNLAPERAGLAPSMGSDAIFALARRRSSGHWKEEKKLPAETGPRRKRPAPTPFARSKEEKFGRAPPAPPASPRPTAQRAVGGRPKRKEKGEKREREREKREGWWQNQRRQVKETPAARKVRGPSIEGLP